MGEHEVTGHKVLFCYLSVTWEVTMRFSKTLTDAAVQRFKTPAKDQEEHWDVAVAGLGIRITSKGRRSWVLMKRLKIGSKALVRFTIGEYPAMSLAAARAKAGHYIDIINAGGDPREEAEREMAATEARRRNTFEIVAREFIEKYAQRKIRSWARVERGLELHVFPHWRNRLIDNITRRDVNDLMDKLVESGLSVQANRVLAYVRKLFNWCIERGILETSPAFQVKPPTLEQPRERDLRDDEIASLWPAFDALKEPFATYLKLLLILGQRRTEVATMRWQDIDLEKAEWTLPRELTKAKRTHVIPLPMMAVDILKGVPRFTGPYVFTTTEGERPISGFGRVKQRLDKAIAKAREENGLGIMVDWTLHDLRRTVATRMAELGVSIEHISRVLNHAPRGITATVYDKHTYVPEKRKALEIWTGYLKNIVAPETKGNVVKLRG
jgi:integrase